MESSASDNWYQVNQDYLMAALAEVHALLASYAGQEGHSTRLTPPPSQSPFPLDTLCQAFGLSVFERDILLLCAGIELDSRLAALCAALQKTNGVPIPPLV